MITYICLGKIVRMYEVRERLGNHEQCVKGIRILIVSRKWYVYTELDIKVILFSFFLVLCELFLCVCVFRVCVRVCVSVILR